MAVDSDGPARTGGTGVVPGRLVSGAGWGAVATVLMSVVMLFGMLTGVAPLPSPVPVALVARTVGALPQPVLVGLAVLAHLAYGAVAAAVLVGLVRRVSVWIGLGYGVLLWGLLGLVWLPYLSWGLFGIAVTPRIAAATLLPHLVYGLTLGLVLDRHHAPRRRTTGIGGEAR
ncbi:hypothetical protein J2S53_004234 [Actinopolyspora lacussalsi]|uniref:Uncharacterized protein n=1 Tax=Actinopolyspora righensis TaxID=995060 RepID=A0A1I6Z042_9ACTN|nr:DUF6789 family protein [Actinopolyspora righensis]MDP9644289.1 hypothetical protein [Actinopolyspora lacussalsi]SFT56044.1 hypothetical protein SAMN04487904_103442 [Actinopolyspora righensis]